MPHIDGVPTGDLQEFEAMDDAKRLLADDPENGAGLITLAESAKYFGKFFRSNENLLDNWYFFGGGSQQGGGQFPINQRGQTKYTGPGYAIDRFFLRGQYTSLELDDMGIKLIATDTLDYAGINQSIESPNLLIGKTYTLSALIDENTINKQTSLGLWSGNTVGSNSYALGTPKTINNYQTGLFSTTITIDSLGGYSHLVAGIFIGNNITGHLKIRAMKLELGDHQTLAHKEGGTWVLNDPPPNYALELAKCQRYLMPVEKNLFIIGRIFGSNPEIGLFFIPSPVIPRANAAKVEGITVSFYKADGNHMPIVPNVNIYDIKAVSNGFTFNMTIPKNMTPSVGCIVEVVSEFYLDMQL